MRRMQQVLSAKVAFGVAVLLLFPLAGGAANQMAQISGQVRDSGGVPVTGALVVVAAASSIPDRITLTDKTGSFAIMDLFAGQYSVKVSMPRFLPATKQGVQLYAGESAVLTINLQN
ncbi:MAG: carboxypeptidase regulatory-like domain-containing protein, partial [Acidobacteria bacterium]|nr:carboxypeptidase regulatory-like domain-containing protein [Acidobacteriota bacterium]